MDGAHPAAAAAGARCWPVSSRGALPARAACAVGFDYEVAANAEIDGHGRRARPGAGLRPAARRDHPQPAGRAGRGHHRRRPAWSFVRQRAVHAADPAGGGLPDLPEMPSTAGTIGADLSRPRSSQVVIAAGRDDTLPVLTGVRIEIDGDRLTLAATDRYRLAVRELRWRPERPGCPPSRCVPARTLAETAKSLTGGAQVSVALSTGDGAGAGQGADRLRGQGRGWPTRRAPHHHAAARRGVRQVPLAAARLVRRSAASRDWLVRRGGQAGCPGRAAQHPGAADLHRRPGAARRGHRRRGPGVRVARRASTDAPAEDSRSRSTRRYLLDGLGAVDAETTAVGFTTPKKPASLPGGKESESRPPTATADDFRYLLMPVRLSG